MNYDLFFRRGIKLAGILMVGVQIAHAQSINEGVSSQPYLGLLNEAPFSFPADAVRNVEYDGDPSWGAATSEKNPNKVHQGFRSLGFRIDFPSFNVLKNRENSNESTIGVTLTANSYYGDGGFLERSVRGMNHDEQYRYSEKARIYGLRHFPLEIDGKLANASAMRDFDIYISVDSRNKVSALIRCGNARGERSVCRHFLQIDELRTRLTLNYERRHIANWRLIQVNSISALRKFENQ